MSDEKRKQNKHSTGTVPKVKYTVKYRNNTGQHQLYSESDNFRNLSNNSNNLGTDWLHRMSETNIPRNSQQVSYDLMNYSSEESPQNGIYANGTANSSLSSSSNSRRNSCGTVPKCDNITKYPNKKQIEDKLNQIREYLHITSSLMSGMKNSDDQNGDENEEISLHSMIDALKDSEAKLNALLASDFEENVEFLSPEISHERKNEFETPANREAGRDLQRLKQKGDTRLREAREIQERLARGSIPNGNRMENNLQEFDMAISELDEANSRQVNRKGGVNNFQQPEEENNYIKDEIEELQNQIQVVHNANEDRKKLIQLLDKRDAELRSQHLELQNKLVELQTKKSQVDHLVAALHNGKEQDDDMGSQVRTIITLKDKLEKLKDMVAMVESTEVLMSNGTQEEQAYAWEVYSKAENLLNKDLAKGNTSNQSQLENHLPFQYENRASPSLNMDRSKLLNKNSRDSRSRSNDSNSKVNEKQALQAELRAKKRELEEIMGKHKTSSSNLNHDVGTDNKSEFSCCNSMFDNISGVWTPLLPMQQNQPDSGDRYSSDEGAGDVNEYSEITSNQQNQTVLPTAAPPTSVNVGKFSSERNAEPISQTFETLSQPYFFRGDGNIRGTTVTSEANSSFSRGSSVSNVLQGGKQNMQKQLELIRSVCDSMLPQASTSQVNVHQLRNHLTPSPTYSDMRQFSSPNPHSMNALNVVNAQTENAWPSASGQPNVSFPDAANYQNWLTTNTLQTQAFMLNSLNQCCQMLWLQQRELASLRGVVTTLQERLSSSHYNNENQMTTSSNQSMSSIQVEPLQNTMMNQTVPPMNPCSPMSQCRPTNPKLNTVPSACSLPNINQYNPPPVTVVDPILANHNNLRLMDTTLNNINVMNNTDHMRNINLATLHGAGDNINALPGHMWAGHALNNQVPPGNRANNYWDNFRSYSRQNLFSTKSNDGIQNSPIIDRTNNVTPRSTPFEALPKSNSQHLTVSAQENTPQRSCVRPSRRYPNTNIAVVPPDVLNINQNIKTDGFPLTPIQNESRNVNETEASAAPSFPNNATRVPRRHSNVIAPSVENLQNPRRRNASNESVNTEGSLRSRLFEELRENVYREVASLISANEARPHFLIQLFRDLQLVSSDPLRLKTLQSIQVLISQSLRNSQNLISQEPSPNLEVPPISNEFSMQSTVWSPIPPNSVPKNATILEGLLSKKGDVAKVPHIFHEIIPFLNENEHHTVDQPFLTVLKQKILEAKSFKKVVKDTIFQKHFSNVLDHVLSFYTEKPLSSVKMSLLQSVRDLLDRELSFMNLIQSSGESQLNDLVAPNTSQNPSLLELRPAQLADSTDATATVQNGDLAEADQSHVEDEDVEEEGAVGGVLEPPTEQVGTSVVDMNNKDDGDLPSSTEVFATSTEAESQYQLGLDQVPTRLPMKSKSRSNTPNKGKSIYVGEWSNMIETKAMVLSEIHNFFGIIPSLITPFALQQPFAYEMYSSPVLND